MELVEGKQQLHGCLQATICQAVHLHHSLSGHLIEAVEKVEHALHLNKLPHGRLYATVDIGDARLARTRVVEFHSHNPVWNESFKLYAAHACSFVTITIKNQLPVDAEVVGRAEIPVDVLLRSEKIDEWLDLYKDDGKQLEKAKIHVRLHFIHAKDEPNWGRGIMSPSFPGVDICYFPQRTGCEVTLYQNSHLSNSFRPNITVAGVAGKEVYRPARYWEDLYIAIAEAKHFVYVAGWSVNVEITLVRDPHRMIDGAEGVTIGELLKRKADEGVAVLVMPWNDRTSLSLFGNAGLMQTHDEETRKYFECTKVKCFLCPRLAEDSLTGVQRAAAAAQFTHHQKTVVVDAPLFEGGDDQRRQVVSFIGGIDLSDGRYDDESHPLFRHLDTLFLHDFQQKNFPHADLKHGGPREPWHDVHSKLQGAAAWDVLTNFEQRWLKQAPKELRDHSLLNIKEIPDIFSPPSTEFEAKNSWNVQIFRSIDNASVVGFPSDPAQASQLGLMSGKDVTIDPSIQVGYVEAIRRAQRFIYIENQYFFGSCYAWKDCQDSGCLNLVPMEIALKIASKIRANERFAVYVVTPMWPEGQPEGDTVQAILHWNHLTMDMMYKIIARAIEEVGLAGKAHPTDYLNFYCLANREAPPHAGEYVPPETPEEGSNYWNAQINRRFLIYVHAKLMIVDDEYLVMGSANLNQRSLDGARDTEIAHGCYQPRHLNGRHEPARGQVYGYRMSLWYEHLVSSNDRSYEYAIFNEPESLRCVKVVKELAMGAWEVYTGKKVVDLSRHLLPFPVKVAEDGALSELPADGFFPDTKASVMGKKTGLPSILTT